MDKDLIKKILERIEKGEINAEEGLMELRALPFAALDHATPDTHRSLRSGFPEVIYAKGKTTEQIIEIAGVLLQGGENLLITRLSEEQANTLLAAFQEKKPDFNKMAKTLTFIQKPIAETGRGEILVLTAGTADIPVAEEAVVTCAIMGNRVSRVYDVGVAGIHRLFTHREKILNASVIIVVAGMDGALPSVVAGLTSCPVIAVPTSAGYGASFQGLAALLTMLNSCAGGVLVVNIDNGFGAGYAASLINKHGVK